MCVFCGLLTECLNIRPFRCTDSFVGLGSVHRIEQDFRKDDCKLAINGALHCPVCRVIGTVRDTESPSLPARIRDGIAGIRTELTNNYASIPGMGWISFCAAKRPNRPNPPPPASRPLFRMDNTGCFSWGNSPGREATTYLHVMPRSESVELYLYVPICPHCVVI
jgi:hypothetical protein